MNNVTAINMLKMRNLGLSIPDDVYEFVINSLEEIQQYRAIGTVEECREAMERQRVKKPRKREVGSDKLKRIIYHCPNCDKRLYDCAFKNGELDHVSPGSRKSKRCEKCDCRLDWSDTD